MSKTPSYVTQAKSIYNVEQWSEGYFNINDAGEMVAFPDKDTQKQGINLYQLCQEFAAHNLTYPVLVRFTDILQNRVDTLVDAFKAAKTERDYQGEYTAVYPIKVNQQYSVIKKLLAHHSGKVGLEAGSKPELMAILGAGTTPLKIVCNGYKDSEFLRLAAIGQRMGHQIYVVIEKITELRTLLTEIDKLGFAPMIGIRIRLNSVGKGKWQNTGGEKGKFGLTASQVLEAVDILRTANKLDLLQLVHFHIGSQVANIRDIHQALNECARHYAELYQLHVPIKTVDVGGGLGVDYEGSGSRSACSMNYTVAEYAKNVVNAFADVARQHNLPQPNIITESGRAMTAHHAVLITDAIDIEKAPDDINIPQPALDAPNDITALWQGYHKIHERNALEIYHDAVHHFYDAHVQYVHGMMTLQQWAQLERLYFATLHKVRKHLNPNARAHREILDELNEKLADKLFLNFSLFQSMPDVWGIEQLFPITPINRMNESLENRAIIQDITCDSDGQIRQYADGAGIETSLPVPEYRDGEEYLMGMFMVGAYQEILGDLHNLFGDTDSVHVALNDDGSHTLSQVIKGDSVSDVLKFVHFDPAQLRESYHIQLTRCHGLSEQEKAQFLAELDAGLDGYTYFED
ncbi:biosynthetic arginine decarboxylase [Flocculibacter collagenilyticus]|uniref:biosynthetic arginine decarboxylase n=1 Tax=Flocculibacter collagenilyticus TaxID=2744479 RepID=UPI0018F79450|nr:biosynthetic arginine decarboxylase [Flocculibacter collagenilyticus]